MKLKNIAASTVRGIAIAAATVATIGFLSGCAENISCACGSALPELPGVPPSETRPPTAVDSKETLIAGMSAEERKPQ
jgi:hypothetical protein